MAFGDFEFPHNQTLTPDEILESLDAWKKQKTEVARFLLVKDCGLNPGAEFTFETLGGHKINVVHLRDRGVYATYDIGPAKIKLRSKESLNDIDNGNIATPEDAIVREHILALNDYFSMQQSDRPEY